MHKLNHEVFQLSSFARLRRRYTEFITAILMIALLVGLVSILRMVPWQQSVSAKGKVTYFNPMERPQEVDAQIPGRIEEWFVMEGQEVRQGDKIAVLSDIDSKFLDPTQVQKMRLILAAYDRKAETARLRIQSIESQMDNVRQIRANALPAAQQRVQQNRKRSLQAEQTVQVTQQNLKTDKLQLDRIQALAKEGLRSQRDYELSQQSIVKSQTDLERSRQSLEVARHDISISQLEVERLSSSFDNDLSKLQESYLKAQESLAEVQADRTKIEIDLQNVTQRRQQQIVTAPVNGKVVRLNKLGRGKTVKSGDVLCRVVPKATQQAVELFIDDFDAPLVRKGQKVRLMFDGFPAIPLTGIPWAAVGTFGGEVQVVDAVDDGSARYRVLVTPDMQPNDVAWPPAEEAKIGWALRPGTQSQGWIFMEKPVPLYWEVWRRLNAFPPIPMEGGKSGSSKDSTPKPVLKR
jgi:adhesin transport system membrane fusion protein